MIADFVINFFQMWTWNLGIDALVEAVIVCLDSPSLIKNKFPYYWELSLPKESWLAQGHDPSLG